MIKQLICHFSASPWSLIFQSFLSVCRIMILNHSKMEICTWTYSCWHHIQCHQKFAWTVWVCSHAYITNSSHYFCLHCLCKETFPTTGSKRLESLSWWETYMGQHENPCNEAQWDLLSLPIPNQMYHKSPQANFTQFSVVNKSLQRCIFVLR